MKRTLITAGLGVLAALFLADRFTAGTSTIQWNLVIGLPILGLAVFYMFYLVFLKQGGKSANAEHDKRVGQRLPKIIGAGLGALILTAAALHFGPILLGQTQVQAGEAASGLAGSFDAAAARGQAALPPVWVMVTVPILLAAGVWFVAQGTDAEAKTVRGATMILIVLTTVIITAATGVIA